MTTTTVVVRPLRFTDDIPAMQGFLEELGLRAQTTGDSGGWADMRAGAGRVALHSASGSDIGAAPGVTAISAEVADGQALVEQLVRAGFGDAVLIDEAYGQDVCVTAPTGQQWRIGVVHDDLYGYRAHQTDEVDPRVAVAPVLFEDPEGDVGPFLEALGLQRRGETNPSFVAYVAPGGGQIGLHTTETDFSVPGTPEQNPCHLTFTTSEAIADVAARLRSTGHEVTVTREDFGSFCTLIDPDGQEVQVHEAGE